MQARTFSNHIAPMRRLLRAFRRPVTGGYGTRFTRGSRRQSKTSQAQPSPEISTDSLVIHKSSQEPSAPPQSAQNCTSFHNSPAPSACKDAQEELPDIRINQETIKHVQTIADLSRQLAVLGRRYQVAEKKALDYESRVEEFHRILQDVNWQLEEGDEQDLILKGLEAACLYAVGVKKRLASDTACKESMLRFSRDDLLQELQGLLLPAGIIYISDDTSRASEHDFEPEEPNAD